MIALALGLLTVVVMVATGVAASSTGGAHLVFLGVGVQTTTAQVFLTGAIFGWVFVIALWLLRVGIHRSGERCAQLASRRGRRASEWLGFSDVPAEDDRWGGWDEWRQWGGSGRRSGSDRRGTDNDGVRFRSTAASDADRGRSERAVGGAGTARHGGGAPRRPDGRFDNADLSVARTADQMGPLSGGHPTGPVAGLVAGVGVDGGAQGRQVRGGPGAVAGEDRGTEGEHRSGERGQQPGQERGVDRR